VVLLASIIGLDEIVILDGNVPVQSSTFVEAPKRHTRALPKKSPVIDDKPVSAKQPKPDKIIGNEKLMSRKQTKPDRKINENSLDVSRNQVRKVPPGKTKVGNSTPNQIDRSNEKYPWTPNPTPKLSSGTWQEGTDPAARGASLCYPPAFGQLATSRMEQTQWSQAPNDTNNAPTNEDFDVSGRSSVPMLLTLPPDSIACSEQQNHLPFSRHEAVISPVVPPRHDSHSSRRFLPDCQSHETRKRDQAPAAWQSDKKKQHKSQERAFASRSDNPFSSFQHDPNDAESFLDGLAKVNCHPIIPPEELRRIDTSAHARGNLWGQSSRLFTDRRRRQMSANSQFLSNHNILRMKAEEAQAYTKAFAPNQTPYHHVPPSARPFQSQDNHGLHGGNAYYPMLRRQMETDCDMPTQYQDPMSQPHLHYWSNAPIQYDDPSLNRCNQLYFQEHSPPHAALQTGSHFDYEGHATWSDIEASQERHSGFPFASRFAQGKGLQIDSPGMGLWDEQLPAEQSKYDFTFAENDELFPRQI